MRNDIDAYWAKQGPTVAHKAAVETVQGLGHGDPVRLEERRVNAAQNALAAHPGASTFGAGSPFVQPPAPLPTPLGLNGEEFIQGYNPEYDAGAGIEELMVQLAAPPEPTLDDLELDLLRRQTSQGYFARP